MGNISQRTINDEAAPDMDVQFQLSSAWILALRPTYVVKYRKNSLAGQRLGLAGKKPDAQ